MDWNLSFVKSDSGKGRRRFDLCITVVTSQANYHLCVSFFVFWGCWTLSELWGFFVCGVCSWHNKSTDTWSGYIKPSYSQVHTHKLKSREKSKWDFPFPSRIGQVREQELLWPLCLLQQLLEWIPRCNRSFSNCCRLLPDSRSQIKYSHLFLHIIPVILFYFLLKKVEERYESFRFWVCWEAHGFMVQPARAESNGKGLTQDSQNLLQSPCRNSDIFSIHNYL